MIKVFEFVFFLNFFLCPMGTSNLTISAHMPKVWTAIDNLILLFWCVNNNKKKVTYCILTN